MNSIRCVFLKDPHQMVLEPFSTTLLISAAYPCWLYQLRVHLTVKQCITSEQCWKPWVHNVQFPYTSWM
jgi:hypothetical protein